MSRGTPDPAMLISISPTGLSPPAAGFPKTIRLSILNHVRSPLPRGACTTVWALPISLAATLGIDVSFSSSPYLDVSVQAVTFVKLCIHLTMTKHDFSRIAPFGYLRINAHLRLPVAFRS